ncbi:AI-2E family transporter [Rapidithrix thailandica]|uniref:AI-2E family transporter n=1 Tax=Rapidithrix thailandica TaxID=413964 RepID=A0AAW9RZN3_9BACT
MNKLPSSNTLLFLGFLLAFLIGFIVMAREFSDIFSYLLIAMVLSAVLRTPTNYLSQLQFYGFRVPRTLAILVSFMILFGLVALFIYLFVPLVSTQIQVISGIDYENFVQNSLTPLDGVEDFLIKYELVPSEDKGFLRKGVLNKFKELVGELDVTRLINDLLTFTGNFFIGFLAVLFITFFFLYEKGAFRKYFISLIPNNYFEVSIAALSKTEKLLSNYLLGLLLQMISIFSIVSFGLLVVGVDYAVTIGVFAAVANLIPFLGPVLGAIFGLIVGLSTNAGLAVQQDYLILVVKILSVFGVVQFTDNIFLQPIIFSKSVKAHPLVIFLIVFVGANLGKAVGMILAIPTFTILKVVFGEFYKGYKQYQVFRK